MTLEFKKKNEEEIDELPPEEGEEDAIESEKEKLHRLELENAEMRGRQAEREKVEKPKEPTVNQHEANKQRVFADSASLSDEDFEKVYKMPKTEARQTMLDRDNQILKYESRVAHAEAEAKVELSTKYGADFYRYKNEVETALADLSPEARQDPKRVAAFMERTYKSLAVEPTKVKKENLDPSRKKIVSDFEKPKHDPEARGKADEEEDLVEEQHRPLANVLGLRSEKERKEMMEMQAKGGYIPMNLGGGKWFKDPNKGFEIEPKK